MPRAALFDPSRAAPPATTHMTFTLPQLRRASRLLCQLQDEIQATLIAARREKASQFSKIAGITAADTIFQIDRISEAAIVSWFTRHWPRAWPVQVVMEGIEDDQPLTFPKGMPVADTVFKCILDPIDGTREIMYDKRSAWTLAGLAVQRGAATNLCDIVVAAMTELPVAKQASTDQFSAIKGQGLTAFSTDLRTGKRARLHPRLSRATGFEQGFSSFAKFLPDGKALLATFEEAFWSTFKKDKRAQGLPAIFDDQYISTGGQLYEILVGHDRLIADIRPLAFDKLGLKTGLVCHPYDICTALLVQEAGGFVEDPHGKPLDAPLNTTHPVSWVAYANPAIAGLARPVMKKLIRKLLT